MLQRLDPMKKLALSLALLALVTAATVGRGQPALAAALLVLALGAGWWVSRPKTATFAGAPRLAVIQRAGLSPRSGVALLEVDGRAYLVVHGDGFANVTRTDGPTLFEHGAVS